MGITTAGGHSLILIAPLESVTTRLKKTKMELLPSYDIA